MELIPSYFANRMTSASVKTVKLIFSLFVRVCDWMCICNMDDIKQSVRLDNTFTEQKLSCTPMGRYKPSVWGWLRLLQCQYRSVSTNYSKNKTLLYVWPTIKAVLRQNRFRFYRHFIDAECHLTGVGIVKPNHLPVRENRIRRAWPGHLFATKHGGTSKDERINKNLFSTSFPYWIVPLCWLQHSLAQITFLVELFPRQNRLFSSGHIGLVKNAGLTKWRTLQITTKNVLYPKNNFWSLFF